MSTCHTRQFFILLTLVVISFGGKAQDSIPPVFPRHIVEINPAIVSVQTNLILGHGLQYRLSLNRNFFMEVISNGTIIRNWDVRNRYYNNNRLFPAMNQTILYTGYRFAFEDHLFFGLRVGYHYFQFGVDKDDYWITSVSNDNVETVISGFKNHSVLAGIELDKISYKKRKGKIQFSRRHHLFTDYIYCPKIQIAGYTYYPDGSYLKQEIQSQWSANKHGFRMGYVYTQGISKNLGVHIGTEVLYAPILNYDTKYEKFVLRGGKLISPICLSLKIGVTFIR